MLTTTEVIGATVGVASIAFTVGQIAVANIKSKSNGKYVPSSMCDLKMEGIGRSLDSLKVESSEMRQDIRNILTIIRNGGSKP